MTSSCHKEYTCTNPNKVSTHWLFGHSMNHRCINKQTNKQTNKQQQQQQTECRVCPPHNSIFLHPIMIMGQTGSWSQGSFITSIGTMVSGTYCSDTQRTSLPLSKMTICWYEVPTMNWHLETTSPQLPTE